MSCTNALNICCWLFEWGTHSKDLQVVDFRISNKINWVNGFFVIGEIGTLCRSSCVVEFWDIYNYSKVDCQIVTNFCFVEYPLPLCSYEIVKVSVKKDPLCVWVMVLKVWVDSVKTVTRWSTTWENINQSPSIELPEKVATMQCFCKPSCMGG